MGTLVHFADIREYENYAHIYLRDDETPYGGTSYHGETLLDFLLSVNLETVNHKIINRALKECGIQPVTEEEFAAARDA